MNNNNRKYKILLMLTLTSMIFSLALPINASMNYVRQMTETRAWYTQKDLATSSHNNDAPYVKKVVIPSLIVIYVTFIHYFLVALYNPEEHRRNILPILRFNRNPFKTLGKVLSYLCIYTMPVLMPLGIYYAYGTNHYSHPILVFAFSFLILAGAFFFAIFYIIYFINLAFNLLRKG